MASVLHSAPAFVRDRTGDDDARPAVRRRRFDAAVVLPLLAVEAAWLGLLALVAYELLVG